jgi:hypothetical protein
MTTATSRPDLSWWEAQRIASKVPGYGTDIALDEAYHDYTRSAARAKKDNLEDMEQTDLAVLEVDRAASILSLFHETLCPVTRAQMNPLPPPGGGVCP